MSDTRESTQSPTDDIWITACLDAIGNEVAAKYGVPVHQIKGRQRSRRYVEARKAFSQWAYNHDFTLSEIGRWMKKDHTTIIHHLRSNK